MHVTASRIISGRYSEQMNRNSINNDSIKLSSPQHGQHTCTVMNFSSSSPSILVAGSDRPVAASSFHTAATFIPVFAAKPCSSDLVIFKRNLCLLPPIRSFDCDSLFTGCLQRCYHKCRDLQSKASTCSEGLKDSQIQTRHHGMDGLDIHDDDAAPCS